MKLLPQRFKLDLSPKPSGFNPNVSSPRCRFAVFCTQAPLTTAVLIVQIVTAACAPELLFPRFDG